MDDRRPIDEEALRTTLGSRWERVDVVAVTESTNTDLLRDPAVPDRTLRVAELQTAGRGRLDRTWTSPTGAGLTFSVLLRPPVPVARWGWLPLLAGVALHDAVARHVPAVLKWPNDLLAGDGRKLAGILAQTTGAAVVVGVGLNVSTTRAELPVPTATSLALLGADVDRADLLVAILEAFDAWYSQWLPTGDATASGLAAAYRAACGTLGGEVRVETPAGTVSGRALDVDVEGRLAVETPRGIVHVAAGDVHELRVDGGQSGW